MKKIINPLHSDRRTNGLTASRRRASGRKGVVAGGLFYRGKSAILLGVFFAAACQTPRPATKASLATAVPPTVESPLAPTPTPTPTPLPTPPALKGRALILSVDARVPLASLADYFERHPDFIATLVFPSGYFSLSANRAVFERFYDIALSSQVDVAMTMENEPPLPLLLNLKSA